MKKYQLLDMTALLILLSTSLFIVNSSLGEKEIKLFEDIENQDNFLENAKPILDNHHIRYEITNKKILLNTDDIENMTTKSGDGYKKSKESFFSGSLKNNFIENNDNHISRKNPIFLKKSSSISDEKEDTFSIFYIKENINNEESYYLVHFSEYTEIQNVINPSKVFTFKTNETPDGFHKLYSYFSNNTEYITNSFSHNSYKSDYDLKIIKDKHDLSSLASKVLSFIFLIAVSMIAFFRVNFKDIMFKREVELFLFSKIFFIDNLKNNKTRKQNALRILNKKATQQGSIASEHSKKHKNITINNE